MVIRATRGKGRRRLECRHSCSDRRPSDRRRRKRASQIPTAFVSIRFEHRCRDRPVNCDMTRSTSAVAVCCSSDSRSSHQEPRILDGDHRLGGEIAHEVDFPFGERMHLLSVDGKESDKGDRPCAGSPTAQCGRLPSRSLLAGRAFSVSGGVSARSRTWIMSSPRESGRGIASRDDIIGLVMNSASCFRYAARRATRDSDRLQKSP